MSTSERRRRFLISCAALIALLLLLYILRAPILSAIGHFIVIDDDLVSADIIVVLNGGLRCRPARAAELYGAGYAPQIVIARDRGRLEHEMGLYPNESDVAAEMLRRMGVPDDAIAVIELKPGVASTYDEANVIRRHVRQHDLDRVIVVTSSYHTRRARWVFRRVLADTPVTLMVSSAPDPLYDPSDWWHSESGLRSVVDEYTKLGYYIYRYRINPH